MNEAEFWSHIEEAWGAVGGRHEERAMLASGDLSDERAEQLVEEMDDVVAALRARLDRLSAPELLEFDRILERKLYDIDRAEVQEATDGSDDGFLYARGFIVAAGEAYYRAVDRDPSVALMDLECEEMCYLSFHLYEEKFGDMPSSDICRESCSNTAGWAS